MDRHQPSTRSFVPQRSPVFGSVPCESPMRLSICSTTGSRFELSVPQGETLEGLKRSLSQRLRIPKDRLVILHKETQMNAGNLVDQGVSDGSKLTLVPAVEAGLTPQPPRSGHTMIQALENLTETQVSDFLSGRSPLTLALGIGAHLMYVQLQLASQNAVGQQHHGNRNGGKVHSGKTGSSRVSRPYPSPTNPSYVSHTVSPVGTSSPPYHRTPVIRHPHPHAASPTSSPLPSHGPPPCLPLSSAAPLYPPHAVCPSPAAPSPVAPSPVAPSPVAPSPVAPSPAPSSPTPAAPFPEESCSSSAPPSREPGAVIESFVSHSPGVFSGTFSGTLPPISQGGVTHPRRGIATILQILNDLLSATRHHQGAPTSCQLRGPGPASPSCPLTSDPPTATATTAPSRATSEPSDSSYSQGHRLLQSSPSAKHTGDGGSQQQPSSSEENRALRRKLENLQLLMYQRRLCRRARRGTHPSHTSAHPYSQRLRHPWSPGQRKAARRHSNSSLSGSEGTSQDDTEADEVMEESPWKPELTSDLVVA